MTDQLKTNDRKRMSFLTGAALFLGLVVYFNLRSPEPTTVVAGS